MSAYVSSFVTRAEELSSPYVSAARQRSPLVDRTASKVAELAKQYEVESYVKKADELADKAALEALARRARYAAQVHAWEQLAASRADALAASVVTLVDRLLPEEEDAALQLDAAASGVEQARRLPAVVYRRGEKAAGALVASGSAHAAAAAAALRARRDAARRAAREQRAGALALGQRGATALSAFVGDLRDEADARTLPLKAALDAQRQQLVQKYREALAVAAARRGVYTQLFWAKLQEAQLDEYRAALLRRAGAARATLEGALEHARLRAVAKHGEARTLFVEYQDKVLAVTVSAKSRVAVTLVAAKDELTQRYEARLLPIVRDYVDTAQLADTCSAARATLEANVASAKAQLAAQQERLRSRAAQTRALAKERSAVLIAEARLRAAEKRAQLAELAEPYVQALEQRRGAAQARATEVAGKVQREAPALAGRATARVLGEQRGVLVEKRVAGMLEALPLLAVA